MGNVSRDVLRHGVVLGDEARRLHREQGLVAGFEITFAEPDASWSIADRGRQNPSRSPFADQAAQLGHQALHAVAGQPNLFGRSLFIRAAGITEEETRISVAHNRNRGRTHERPRDWPYLLYITREIPGYPAYGVSKESGTGRAVIDRFMALSMEDLVFATTRTPEALSADYARMQRGLSMVAAAHERVRPMDGTDFFFNTNEHFIKITGRTFPSPPSYVPGEELRPWIARRDQVDISVFRYGSELTAQRLVSLTAYAPDDDAPALLHASELIWHSDIGQMQERMLDNEEVAHMLGIFDMLCKQPPDYSLAYEHPTVLEDVQAHNSLYALDVPMLPILSVDLEPLHLMG